MQNHTFIRLFTPTSDYAKDVTPAFIFLPDAVPPCPGKGTHHRRGNFFSHRDADDQLQQLSGGKAQYTANIRPSSATRGASFTPRRLRCRPDPLFFTPKTRPAGGGLPKPHCYQQRYRAGACPRNRHLPGTPEWPGRRQTQPHH